MTKLSVEEKAILKKMSATSKRDEQIITELLISNLCTITRELYSGKRSFIIPYICKFDIEEKQVLNIKEKVQETKLFITATPCKGLLDEFTAIQNNEVTPSEKYIKKRIFDRTKYLLEIKDLDLDVD